MATTLYFHDATTGDTGTLPTATKLTTSTIAVTATGAGTNRAMDMIPGPNVAVTPTLASSATTSAQINWFRRFVSAPLAAQTIGSAGGGWKIQTTIVTSNTTNSPFQIEPLYLGVWRPGTGAAVGTIFTSSTAIGTAATLGNTLTGPAGGTAITATSTVVCQDGDILVLELGGAISQGMSTSYTWTLDYNGDLVDSATNCASYLVSPTTLAWQYPVVRQTLHNLTAATTTTVTPTVTSGNMLLALGASDAGSGTTTISDTASNSWTPLASGAGAWIQAWWATANTTGATTITVTNASQMQLVFLEIQAGKTKPAIDAWAANFGTSTAPSSGATAAAASINEYAVGLLSIPSQSASGSFTFSPALGTLDTNAPGYGGFGCGPLASASAETFSATIGSSVEWACWSILVMNSGTYLPLIRSYGQAVNRASTY